MKGKKEKQLLIICFGILLSVFGLYFTFIHKNTDADTEGTENITQSEENENPYDYTNQELPSVENESDDETYSEGEDIRVYFTNTDSLDKSSMPLSVQGVLTSYSQSYLEQNGYSDVTELKIDDENFIDNEDEVTFNCSMDGYEEQFQVSYSKGEEKLKFYIVDVIET